ncbi:hypothetical protein WJX74_003374 [Apatococcus lobatus]|uniref:Protein kinase domain-containing protein n=1 Tax=Apatococcus lobatus TaxID=904363 RepID=A0AAW1S6G5_9CHLO
MERSEDSPSETLGFVLQFLHTQGFYHAEESLIRELENRYPEGSSAGGSPTAPLYSGDTAFPPLERSSSEATQPQQSTAQTAEVGHQPLQGDSSFAQHQQGKPGLVRLGEVVTPVTAHRYSGSSSRHDHPDESPSLHYTNPDDCGYVREHISGQDDFIARELDLGDEGGAQKQGGPSFHRFLSSQDGGAGDEGGSRTGQGEAASEDEAASSSDGQGSSYFSGEVLARVSSSPSPDMPGQYGEFGESDSAMHDSDPASSCSRPNSAQPSPAGQASPGLPGTPLIFKSPSSLGMPLQPSNPSAGLLQASLRQPPPAGPPHLNGIPEGQSGVSPDSMADPTAGPAQDFGILRPGRLESSGPSFAMQLSAEDTRPVSAPAAPALPLIRPHGDAPDPAASGGLQASSTRSSHAGERQGHGRRKSESAAQPNAAAPSADQPESASHNRDGGAKAQQEASEKSEGSALRFLDPLGVFERVSDVFSRHRWPSDSGSQNAQASGLHDHAAPSSASQPDSTPELVITPRQGTTEPSTPTSQLDIEAGGNFSFPVTPPSEPAAPAAVFGAWPKARRQGHHPHMGSLSSGELSEEDVAMLSRGSATNSASGTASPTGVDEAHDAGRAGHAPPTGRIGTAHAASAPPLLESVRTAPINTPPGKRQVPAQLLPCDSGTSLSGKGRIDLAAATKRSTPAPEGESPSAKPNGMQGASPKSRLHSCQQPAALHDVALQSPPTQVRLPDAEVAPSQDHATTAEASPAQASSSHTSRPHASGGAEEARDSPSEPFVYEYNQDYIDRRYEVMTLNIVHRRRRTGFEETKEFPIRTNDLIAGRYQVMDFLGSAAFSKAVQALDVKTGMLVCLKIIKNNKDYFDQSLDEIKLLKYVNDHDPNDEYGILHLFDHFYYKEHLILVCELLRANLYEFQKYNRDSGEAPYFTLQRVQSIARQVLQSLDFMHSLGLIHADLKPENILIKSYSRCEVKVIDLGSSCFTTDHLSSYVQSRSYRAPEVILGILYNQKVDIWSLGCILAELVSGSVLFQNDSLATLLARMESILGPLPRWMLRKGRYSHRFYTRAGVLYEQARDTGRYEILRPKRTSLNHMVTDLDEGFIRFLGSLLSIDPRARPTAEEALAHPWLLQNL